MMTGVKNAWFQSTIIMQVFNWIIVQMHSKMWFIKPTNDNVAERYQFQHFIREFPCTYVAILTEEANFLSFLSQTLLLF